MSRSILVAGLCMVTLAGCGRTIVRERIVEQQPVITPAPTVVERPVLVPGDIVTAQAACPLAGNAYSSGTLSCQGGYEYRCRNGVWERIEGNSC